VIDVIKSQQPLTPVITTDRRNVCGTEKAILRAAGCNGIIVWSTGERGVTSITGGAGTYTAKCENACGISPNSNVVQIQSGGTPDSPTIVTNKTSLCGADSARLVAAACSGIIKWSDGSQGDTLFVKQAGSYTATCTNDCGVSLASFPETVITNGGKPSAPKLSTIDDSICDNQSAIITADGCSGTVNWSNDAAGLTITVNTPGIYTATCTNDCGVSDASEGLTITRQIIGCVDKDTCDVVKPILKASKTNICTPETITLSSQGCDGTVIWSNGRTGTSITIKPLVTTSYTAVCQKGKCVSEVSAPIQISIGKAGRPLLACSTELVCEGESVTLKAYNCTGTILWSTGQTGATILVTPTSASKYTAICKIGDCESDNADSLSIAVGPPNKPFVTCKNSTICLGETSTLTAAGCTGKVIWSNGKEGTLLSITPDKAGKYTYTAICRSVAGKCESVPSNAITVTVGAKVPTPQILAELKNTCPFETVDLNNAILGEPTSTGNNFEFRSSSSSNSPIVTTAGMANAGTYYVFERSAANCYSDPAAVKVVITDCGDGGIGIDTTKSVDIAVTKTANTVKVPLGEVVSYKVSVTNLGKVSATNVVIRDVLPNGLTFKLGSSNMTFADGSITSTIGSLAVGQIVEFNYTAEVTAPGKIVNRAALISVTQVDNVVSNNSSEFTINDPASTQTVGLSKVCGEAIIIGPQKYEIPFTIFVTNMGNTELSNIQVTDDLDRAFGNGAVLLDSNIVVTVDSGLVANAIYTGTGDKLNLLEAAQSKLAVGQKSAINFKVKVDLSNANIDEFFNIAKVTVNNVVGDSTTQIADLSTNGFSPDPDGDGDPSNNDEPSPIILNLNIDPNKPAIGVALAVVDTLEFDDKAYDITYVAIVQNLGGVMLKNIQMIDSLSKTFADTLKYEIVGTPMVNAEGTIKINKGFDGRNNPFLLTGDSTSMLAVAQADTVFFTVRVYHQNNSGPFFSSILASGTFGTAVAVDTSNSGLEIIPTDNSPTVVRIPIPLNLLVIIPDGFSPNGDNVNDTYTIKIPTGIALEEFHIYNRWGHLVYTDQNENILTQGWNGEANTGILSTTTGVPDGTYYYSIKLSNEEKRRVGFITVAR
jgi:uncharacterized repeat protein (TIGR01451 family)/gliding motility-associated-like protein